MNNKFNLKKRFAVLLLGILSVVFAFSGCSEVSGNITNAVAGNAELSAENLQVHFISVGQGDSELIKLPTGENVLIDAGDTDCAETLLSYLKKQGVEEIDMAVATHPHSDHIGSMQKVIENFKVDKILMPDRDYDTLVYTNLLYSIDENNVERIVAKYGDEFDEGDAHFEVLGPIKEYDEVNDSSIVLMMTYGDNRFLFTGDQESDAEKDVISMGYDLHADVLKVGHHGSKTSSCQEFIDAVRPSIAVIEVGEGNKYGLPKDEVIMRIARSGATVYRTDKSGNIVISSDGKKLYVKTDDSFDSMMGLDEDYSESSATESTAPSASEVSEETSQTPTEEGYIGNKNSKVYHSLNCGSLPSDKNRVEFSSREEAESQGYTPHSKCVK